MVRRWLIALAVLVAMPAMGQSEEQMLRQAELSMVVTGHVDIAPDGSVSSHGIRRRDQLPDYVVAMVDEAAATWRFEPIEEDGVPVKARARMSLRLVGQAIDGGDEFAIRIANGSFGGHDRSDTGRVVGLRVTPPRYPDEMLRQGSEGTVYLLLKIGRNGRVQDLAVERVNLGNFAGEREMEQRRRIFATSAERAARRWVYRTPSTGPYVDRDSWVVRVPVVYELARAGRQSQDESVWSVYIPGPTQQVPEWGKRSGGSDAALAGVVQMVDSERTLLSPLQGPGSFR